MYIDKKHFNISTGDPIVEYPPILYLNWFKIEPERFRHIHNSSFYINVGFFDHFLNIELKWGFVEREMNEREKEREKRNKKFIEAVNNYEKEK